MDILVEEHIWFQEDIQGNYGPGLVFENEISDELDFFEHIHTVITEEISEVFDLYPDFTPSHEPWCNLEVAFNLNETMGHVPVEVYQSNINVVYAREAAPVKVWWMGLNVIHGPDTFYEEVYSNLYADITYCQGVPHYHIYIYESFDLDWNNIQPHPGIHIVFKFQLADYFNTQHFIEPDYYFNSKALERLFTYDKYKWSWKHDIEDGATFNATVNEIIGKIADEHIRFRTGLTRRWEGQAIINDTIFSWDRALRSRGWTHVLEEEVSLEETVRAYLELILQDWLISEELVKGEKELFFLSEEQFKLADRLVNSFKVQVQDEIGLEDEPLKNWLGKAFLESQADFTTEVTPKSEHDVHVEMKISLDGNLS